MKPQLPWLLALFASSPALAHSEPSPMLNPTPASPLQLEQQLLQQHSERHLQQKEHRQPPKQIRSVSPRQVEQLQYNQLNKSVATPQLSEATDLQMQTQSNQNVVVQNTGCTTSADLTGLSGAALVSAIEQGSLTGCLYQLYNASLANSPLFADANLQTVTDALLARLAGFDGSNATGAAELEKLVTYLRAMHWASWGNNRVFQAQYKTSLQQAFDLYFNAPHFVQFNGSGSRNFMLRYEMLILVRSSGSDVQRYIKRFSQALGGYAQSVSRANNWGVSYEENGLTQILTHFFNETSQGSASYINLLNSNPEIVENLKNFVLTDGQWLLGHTREYQLNDAVSELGRLLKLGGAIAAQVRPAMQHILSTYSYGGTGSQAWVNAQAMVKSYDSANCALYGNACQFNLEDIVLSGRHQCGATLKIRYQEPISPANLQTICTNLAAQEQKFHLTFGTTPATPVANDQNEDLEMVIFKSSTDYQNYAGDFFGISTDNGGMYLEGTPSEPDNQARFIAYQATWLAPAFVVWNLEHEYVHYLDGRFNQWGSFSDQPANSVWWSEGLAEYLSQPANNPGALALAPNKTYPLSTLFQTTYANSNTDRTYRWGYLAVRYMFERQRAELDQQLLPTLRAAKYLVSDAPCAFDWGWQAKPVAIANNWAWLYDDSEWGSGYWVWTCGQQKQAQTELPAFTPYQDILNSWGTGFNEGFNQWLDCLVAGQGHCQTQNFRPGDLDKNQAIDSRDVDLFNQLLRQKPAYSSALDFNADGKVNAADVPALSRLCDLARCAIAG